MSDEWLETVDRYFADMRRIILLLREFYNPHEALDWMISPKAQWDYRSPAHLIAAGRTQEVETMIQELRSWTFPD